MRVLLVCVALLLSRAALAADPDPALVAEAQKEGQVTWYSTLIVNQIVRPMVEAFETRYPGIKVQYLACHLLRHRAEDPQRGTGAARAGRPVRWLQHGVPAGGGQPRRGIQAARPPRPGRQNCATPKGHWTALNLFYWTSAYNTEQVKAEEAPKTYDDLLDPKWKGKIAWTYDLTPGGPPGFVHNILATYGQEKGMEYLKKFAAQQPVTIPAAQRVVLDKVISGEYPLAVMILNYHATISARAGRAGEVDQDGAAAGIDEPGQHREGRTAPERRAAVRGIHAVGRRARR